MTRVQACIRTLRGQRVLLDAELAPLYDVPTKALIQAVKRNRARFPPDFMFRITREELQALRSQFVTSNGRGGRRHLPYAFTEQGVAMLSSVLRSARAVRVNIEIMRAFVRLRGKLVDQGALAERLDALEARHDRQFKVVFDAMRALMAPPDGPKRRIGFRGGRETG